MKKIKLLGMLIVGMTIGVVGAGCGKSENDMVAVQEEATEEAEDVIEDNQEAESEEADSTDANTFSAKTDELPDYEYPGPELFYYELYDYVEDFNEDYSEADVSIPCIQIAAEDESDKNDIKVYGNFAIYNYNLDGDTLACASGGSYPGVMHIKSTDEGYEVVSFDVVGDGSDFDESAKEIFGDKYDDFMKIYSDDEARETVRAQIISNYVFANNLDIQFYQDYGWDKKPLPEQNIDSFYSQLD